MEKIFVNLPVLETERLILRKIEAGDHKAVFEYSSDPEVAQFMTWDAHKTPENSKHLVKFIMKRYKDNKPANWAVILKSDNKLIGTCGFVSSFPANKRAEISFAIRKDCWGRGYATEAVKKTIEFGFKEIKYNRIEAFCDVENKASSRVMEKCGMKPEGVLRQYAHLKGKFRDMKCYAILAEDAGGGDLRQL
jgi:[ribosomal protein S5]-alanine N-acetyltransferase